MGRVKMRRAEPLEDSSHKPAPPRLEHLGHRERELWRSALLLLVVLATALALVSWDKIRTLPQHLEALPAGLVILVILFGAYVWSKMRETAELRGLLRGLEQRSAVPPDETQLKQLFALISRSQQGFRDLIDTFDDILLSFSLDGEIRAANRSFAELVGLAFPQIVGHRLDEFLDLAEGSGRAAAEKALPRFLQRRHWSGILRVRLRSDATVRYFDCVLHAMVKGDRVVGLSGLARDVTQQRESEARFTELFETLQEGVYFATPEGKLLDANPALVRLLGYASKEELLGVRVEELYFDPSERAAEMQELERQGGVHGRQITLRHKDGTPLICLDTSTANRDVSGRVMRCQGTLVDITQRREIERRLQQEQEFARRLVDNLPDLIVALDSEARYTFVSPRITPVLGYRPEEFLGQRLGERTHPEDRAAVLLLYGELIQGKRTSGTIEYRTQHKNGEWRLFRAAAGPLFDAEGKIAGVIASSRDITELKQMEKQLLQSEKLAAMGQMIAGVAHELNNPLTAVLGVSELLRERATDETTRRQLDLAHRQARRAAHIVQNLLSFAQPPAPGKKRLHVGELLQRTLQLHEPSLRGNRIAVDFFSPPDLPTVLGDASQLTQVFLNLITNAEQAVRDARDHGTLSVRLETADGSVRVTIRDDGPGIRPEIMPRLFDPFFTTKRPGGGTGLGLSICMAIVREHGGSIEARNHPEGGAVFSLSFPLAGGQPGIPPSPELVNAETSASSLQDRAVLVVDDEESIRELVHDGLSARGVRVDCVSTGEQALGLVTERDYDVVLLDLHLFGPGTGALTGKELAERLSRSPASRTQGQRPLVVFMTGDLVDRDTVENLSRDGSHVVQKPFRISDLVALISEALPTAVRS